MRVVSRIFRAYDEGETGLRRAGPRIQFTCEGREKERERELSKVKGSRREVTAESRHTSHRSFVKL